MPDEPKDYRQSLLFRYCKTEEAYRAALAGVERRKRHDAQRWRRIAIAELITASLTPTPPRPSSPATEAPDKLRIFIAYLESACQTYPDKMREIQAPLLLDILEEYQAED